MPRGTRSASTTWRMRAPRCCTAGMTGARRSRALAGVGRLPLVRLGNRFAYRSRSQERSRRQEDADLCHRTHAQHDAPSHAMAPIN
jgi:hypothetical protein